MQAAKLVGAVALFEYLMSVPAVKVRPLVGLPCAKLGELAVPTASWLGRVSTSQTELLSVAVGPVLATMNE